MSADVSRGLSQVERIASLCNFLDHSEIKAAVDRSVPVSMPHDVGSLGFDTPLWIGLGIVGLWSALDAIVERTAFPKSKCGKCGGLNCLWSSLMGTGKLVGLGAQALAELEDMRHLFAHNFAGHADAVYFGKKKRHVLVSGTNMSLSSGAIFDGGYLSLSVSHLRYYAERSREILRAFL